MGAALMRLDLHLHTEYSHDCDTSLDRIEPRCLARSLTGLAVTDHNTVEGAMRLRDSARHIQVIVGEEVSTRDGDVIGLFLSNRIPPRMSAIETMEAIHDQNGLVYLPHPFNRSQARRHGGASLYEVMPHVDIVETFNGKVARPHYNEMAEELALRFGKARAGGSDAHSLMAIGTVTNTLELDGELTAQSLLNGLRSGLIEGARRHHLGGLFVIGRRPFSLALRRLRGWSR